MNPANFVSAYSASRNGINERYRHPLVRSFVYSDGVKEVADEGCHWLLDIVATECAPAMRKDVEYFGGMGFVTAKAVNSKATLTLARDDGFEPYWRRHIKYTDLPDGKWLFYLTDEGDHVFMILPTEY